MKVTRRNHGPQVFQPADSVQTDDRQCRGTCDQNQGLHGIGINYRGQSAGDGVNPGGDDQHHRSLPQRPSGDPFENHARSVELHGNFGENVSDDRNSSQIHGALAVKAALQKLRHSEHVAAKVKRNKHPAEDQQD